MIRTIKYSLFVALVLGVVSCQKEQDPVFESSASARVENAIAEYRALLEGSENGWVLQYFPGEEQNKGGYNYFIKFKEHNLADVVLESGDAVESEYQIHQNGGVVISFVTYNEKMHFFSTPSSYEPRASQGDYEFIVVSKTENTIYLKGLKYRSNLVLKKIPNPEYVTKINNVEDMLGRSAVQFVKEDDSVEQIDFDFSNKTYKTDDGKTESFVFTDTGIHFYEPVLINGVLVQDLNIVENEAGGRKLVSPSSDLEFVLKTLAINFKTKNYTVFYPIRKNALKTAWNQAIEGIKKIGDEWEIPMVLGKTLSFKNGGHFYAYVSFALGGLPVEVSFIYKPSQLGDDYITIAKGTPLSAFFDVFEPGITPLINFFEGTFRVEKMEEDGYVFYRLQEVTDPTKYFVLSEVPE